MSSKVFLFICLALIALVVVASPPVLPALVREAHLPCGRHGQVDALVETKVTPTPTPLPPTFTPTASPQPAFGTATPDPFAYLPTAMPLGGGGWTVPKAGYAPRPAGASQGGVGAQPADSLARQSSPNSNCQGDLT
jgi:hypothetical protein